MAIVDWIFIVLIVIFLILGLWLGFGKGLRFFTKGIFGFILSVFICYILGGFIYQLDFVQRLLIKLYEAVEAKEGWFFELLLTIRIDIIVYYVALFIIVQILRIIIVKIIVKILEINNVVFKIINKVLGAVFFLGVLAVLTLFVFQIICWIGSGAEEKFISWISDSKLQIQWIYEHNPLKEIVEILFRLEFKKVEYVPVTACL